jgi:hypothetical protein
VNHLRCIVCFLLDRAAVETDLIVDGYSVCEDHIGDARRAATSGLTQVLEWIRQEREAAKDTAQ